MNLVFFNEDLSGLVSFVAILFGIVSNWSPISSHGWSPMLDKPNNGYWPRKIRYFTNHWWGCSPVSSAKLPAVLAKESLSSYPFIFQTANSHGPSMFQSFHHNVLQKSSCFHHQNHLKSSKNQHVPRYSPHFLSDIHPWIHQLHWEKSRRVSPPRARQVAAAVYLAETLEVLKISWDDEGWRFPYMVSIWLIYG